MRCLLAVVAALCLAQSAGAAPRPLRERLLPSLSACEVWLIDREQGLGQAWSTTKYHGGSHWTGGPMRDLSYGLGQAYPPEKMAAYGKAWRTSPWVQLKWFRSYVAGRYGSCAAAQAHWRAVSWY